MALSGVLSSWLIEARKRDLARLASSARRRASSDIDFAVSSSAISASFSERNDKQHQRRTVEMAGDVGEERQRRDQQRRP